MLSESRTKNSLFQARIRGLASCVTAWALGHLACLTCFVVVRRGAAHIGVA